MHTRIARAVVTLALASLAPATVTAQNEAALRAAFEGRQVIVKVDMPATSRGIDVFPQDGQPVNWRDVAGRMKEYGTALKPGQQVMITKVLIKKDSHIEFQLGGGGWGTFGDFLSSSSSVSAESEGESQSERDLKARIKQAQGPTERKRLERELSTMRSERERENSRARAEAAQANEAREANMRVKRAESGSRFNIRYRNGIPPEAMTPDGLIAALGTLVEFPGITRAAAPAAATSSAATLVPASLTTPAPVASAPSAPAAAPAPAQPAAGSAQAVLALRKGLALAEVEALLGPAASASEVKEGTMTAMKRVYVADGKRIRTSFVGGVLIDYSITPQ